MGSRALTWCQVLDLFITLLHLGASGWRELLEARRAILPSFRQRLSALAQRHGERLLHTPNNGISMAVTVTPPAVDTDAVARPPAALGASLFVKLVSGVRVVAPSSTPKQIAGLPFLSYGSHSDETTQPYFSVACALGISADDVDTFLRRLDRALAEWKKGVPRPNPPPPPPPTPPNADAPTDADADDGSAPPPANED